MEKLLADYLKAKKAEDKAKKKRLEIEEQISDKLEVLDGKSKTFHFEGFKVTKKINESWKFLDAWKSERNNIPEEFRPEKIKYDVDTKGLGYLKEQQPDLYKAVSFCIEMKENKPSISVEKE